MYSKMYYLILLLIEFNSQVNSIHIEKQIYDYFNSEIYNSFQNKWQSYKTSQENAVVTMLKENYGYKPMNVYVRQLKDSYLLTKGFYITDNIVDLLMLDLKLSEIPHVQVPEVKLGLASNYLHLSAGLSPIVVQTYYLLFRNDSSIVYGRENQDPYKHSPFTFPQVHEFGEIAIRAESCTLSGTAILTLDGTSVNLAHNTFQVKNCTFTIEISTPGTGLPPVIAPYFSEEQGKKIENLISKPLRDELIPKLQGTLFSFLNTSAIFGADLKKYRKNQKIIVKVAAQYMTEVAGKLNKATIQKNQGYVDLPDSGIRMKSVFNDRPTETSFLLANVSMYGLDTVYSAQSGGPYKTNNGVKLAEAIRYHSLQIRGKIYFENKTIQGQQEFAVELLDVNVDVTINLNDDKNKYSYELVGWREMEFSLGEFKLFAKERIASHALITGYLINEVPKTLISHLEKLFPIVAEMSDNNPEQNSRSEINSVKNQNELTEDDDLTDETRQKQHDKGLDSENVINNRTGLTENSDHKTQHEKEIAESFFSQSDQEKKGFFSEDVSTENKSPLFSDSDKSVLTEDHEDILASDKEKSDQEKKGFFSEDVLTVNKSPLFSGSDKSVLTEDHEDILALDKEKSDQEKKGFFSEDVLTVNKSPLFSDSDKSVLTEDHDDVLASDKEKSDQEKKGFFSEDILTENKSPLFSDSDKGVLTEDHDDVLASDKKKSSLSSNPNEGLTSDADDYTDSEEIMENEKKSSESEEASNVESSNEQQITVTETQDESEENSEKQVEQNKDSLIVSAESNEHNDDGSYRGSIASAGIFGQTDSDSILGTQSDDGTISQGVITSGVLTSDKESLRSAGVSKGIVGDKPIFKDHKEKKKSLLRNKTKKGQKNRVHESEQKQVKYKIRSSNTNKRRGQVFHRNRNLSLIHMSENEIN